MGRRIRLKLKRSPRDLKKKVGMLCDFCGFSSRYDQLRLLHERDHEAEYMESELKRLRLLTRRMTGKDLDGLSFTELIFLANHQNEVLLLVRKKIEQVSEADERLRIQNEAEDEGKRVLVPCNSSGERRLSEAEAMLESQMEFERRKAESKEMEFERLFLLKERLNGRELDGMTSRELCFLRRQIQRGLVELQEHKFAATMDCCLQERAAKRSCSLSIKEKKREKIGILQPDLYMEREMKRRKNNSTEEKATVPCNFCEYSSSRYGCISEEENLDEKDNEAVLLKEVLKLRLLIKRMTGKDECASHTELLEIMSHLSNVHCTVTNQKDKAKLEEDENRKKEAEDDRTRRGGLVRCNSSKESQKKQSHEGARLLRMKRDFERRNAESLQSEFDRLWLLNERMNGRELEGMTSFELALLAIKISGALVALTNQTSEPIIEKRMARQRKKLLCHDNKEPMSKLAERERCSSTDDTLLQFRLPLVSRKLRRFRNCYQ